MTRPSPLRHSRKQANSPQNPVLDTKSRKAGHTSGYNLPMPNHRPKPLVGTLCAGLQVRCRDKGVTQ